VAIKRTHYIIMIQQVTMGIRISVETKYEGSFLKNSLPNHAFRYLITIENQSNEIIQLVKRHWNIMESTKPTQIFEGPGVVGKKSIIKTGQMVQYESGCIINSQRGAMKGFLYHDKSCTAKEFNLEIPVFQLDNLFSLN